DQLHIDVLIIQLPDAKIEFQEKIRAGEVAEEKTAVSVSYEVLVISELKIEIFPGIEVDGSPVVIIIHPRLLKDFIIARARHRMELGYAIHHILRSPLLVVRKIG